MKHGVILWKSSSLFYLLEEETCSLQILNNNNNNNNNNPRTIFIVLSSWPLKVIDCKSSLGSFDECRVAHKRMSTLRPSHLTWAVSPPVGSYRLQPPSPFIIITQPESWYSFTVPRRVEGWVDLGTAGRVHTACAQGCKLQWLCDKHNCPQRYNC